MKYAVVLHCERLPVEGLHTTVDLLALKDQNESTLIVPNENVPGGELSEEEVTRITVG